MNDRQRSETIPATDPVTPDALDSDTAKTTARTKLPFVQPKLTFVPPKLIRHGSLTELTGFFGAFSP